MSEVSFEACSFSDLPGWERDDHRAALVAFAASAVSCDVDPAIAAEAERIISGADAARSARAFFERRFIPHRVVQSVAEGLLTGYYEPVLKASRTRTTAFGVPVLKRPPELVNLVDETLRGDRGRHGGLTHARKAGDGHEPFDTREAIETGSLDGRGLELAWLADPVDAFFMHIQGSGCLELTDGTTVRIGYDGKNGHPYTSVGRHLIDTGQIATAEMSLARMADWLRAEPERGRRAMWQNQSYVFFRELLGEEGRQAQGARKIPLHAGRSLAVDASMHRLGTPIYVEARSLTAPDAGRPFQRLMIAHDVGSAIVGPERGDIYFGSGAEAGRLAGETKHAGRFFVLLPSRADLP